MCFFKKKKSAEKTALDRELVASNSRAVETLIVLSEDEALTNRFNELKEKLKYLIPFEDGDVKSCDKRISNIIDDLRIELSKTKGAVSEKTDKLIKDIELAIAARRTEV
ncbi:MAG: hypothetical protein HDT28_00105 [Clostridiales bacterium]|nr:hypothetical protein [Clostridiales bacterium]